MGSGKTEAALAAAEILAAKTKAGGIFIALPTQATTDAMLARTQEWLRLVPTLSTLYLAHGKSRLNKQYEGLLRDAYFRSIGQDQADGRKGISDDDAIAHRWLSDGKRGPLANVMVGTIDQGLFLALKSKHLMLRHLALAGKVVIIDEAHAYSAYMNVYLNQVLHWLGAYSVPVVLLSATLPGDQRMDMVLAYEEGRRRGLGGGTLKKVEKRTLQDTYKFLSGDIGYPAITHTRLGELPAVALPEADDRTVEIALGRLDDGPAAIAQTLQNALQDGGCAAVIHNTVRRVQETARYLRGAVGDDTEIIVAHSRFLAADRLAKDSELLDKFGSLRRAKGRPVKAIVVASQVIEQSLDIDFDIMVSDLAPIDLLFQRSGRLHRHPRGEGQNERPVKLRQAQLFLTGVEWNATLPEPQKSYQRIYHPHILYRTLAVLAERSILSVPADIPVLVQKVYGPEKLGIPEWQVAMSIAQQGHAAQVRRKQDEAEDFRLSNVPTDSKHTSLVDWNNIGVGDLREEIKGQAAVRDAPETLEVLVVYRNDDGEFTTPPWLADKGGLPLPLNQAPSSWLAKVILGCSLSLPAWMCAGGKIDALISTLERETLVHFPEWAGSHELRGELALVFNSERTFQLNEYTLRYDEKMGLDVMKDA